MDTNLTIFSEKPTLILDPAMSPNNAIVLTIVMLAILLGAVVALPGLRRRRVERLGQMAPEELQRWRADIVKQVGVASQTQGAHVTLRTFWKKTGLSGAQKYVVLKDLLDRQVFYPAFSSDRLVAFFQYVSWT